MGGLAGYNRMEEDTYEETVVIEKERSLVDMLASASEVPRILPAHLRVLVRRINYAIRPLGQGETSSEHVELRFLEMSLLG